MRLKNKHLRNWSGIVSQYMPHLTIPQVTGLATWSFGMAMTRSSSLSKVSEFIALVNEELPNTVRARLKEWYRSSEDKKGQKRTELNVTNCFAPLLNWLVSSWPADNYWLPLAMDATNIF